MAVTTILPEVTLTFAYDDDYGAFAAHGVGAAVFLTEGETYKVIWDESTFTCVAFAVQSGNTLAHALGNPAAIGGEDNEMPFILACNVETGGTSVFCFDKEGTHTLSITQGEERSVIVRDFAGRDVLYAGVEQIALNTNEGDQQFFTKGALLKNVSTPVDFSAGDMYLQLPEGYVAKDLTIEKPESLVPENIKKGETIAGIKGALVGNPEEVEVELNFADGDQIVTPSTEDKLISKATIKKPDTLVPENIMKDIDVAGVVGSLEVTAADRFPAALMDDTLPFPFIELTDDTVFPSPVRIKSSAFTKVAGLQKVNLSTVLSMDTDAFASCPDLREVRFGRCTYAGWGAFQYCSKLETVHMPELSKVNTSCFYYCSKLSSIHMPKVTMLDDRAFTYCSQLSQVSLPECSELGIYALAGTKGPYYLPALKWFGERAIYGSTLYASAYYYSDILTSTAYGSSIYKNAYWPLSASTRIIGGQAFSSKQIYGVTNSANVQYIGPGAFYSCSYLKSASFPACKGISSGAFNYCKSLSSIYFPEVEELGGAMFISCTLLTAVSFPKVTSLYSSTFASMSIRTASIPLCSYISGGAFQRCYYLSSVYAPECKTLGYNAFAQCSSLTKMSMSLCEHIGYAVFSQCSKLASVSFPKCSLISDYAFWSCSVLSSAIFPECTTVGSNAFNYCSKLSTVSLPKCSLLKSWAFNRCASLTTISLPKCTTIGNGAFSYCTALKTLYLMGSEYVTLEGSSVFYGAATATMSVYVPASMVASYRTRAYWSSISARFIGV